MKHRNSIAKRAGKWAAVGCILAGAALFAGSSANAQGSGDKPNILIIWGDDIGVWNTSAYNHGMMRYQTSKIILIL